MFRKHAQRPIRVVSLDAPTLQFAVVPANAKVTVGCLHDRSSAQRGDCSASVIECNCLRQRQIPLAMQCNWLDADRAVWREKIRSARESVGRHGDCIGICGRAVGDEEVEVRCAVGVFVAQQGDRK